MNLTSGRLPTLAEFSGDPYGFRPVASTTKSSSISVASTGNSTLPSSRVAAHRCSSESALRLPASQPLRHKQMSASTIQFGGPTLTPQKYLPTAADSIGLRCHPQFTKRMTRSPRNNGWNSLDRYCRMRDRSDPILGHPWACREHIWLSSAPVLAASTLPFGWVDSGRTT